MCDSWNFPMFLLRDGSFTLMKMASLMFLTMLLSSNSHQRNPNQMGQFPFWTVWLHHKQMDQLWQLSTENQPILTCICIGTATTTWLQNSVINILRHRAKTVCTTKQLLEKEEDHLFTALRRCKYPVWAWNWTNIQKKQKKNNQGISNTKKSYIVMPYMKGLR